jgi:lipopolysaccharide/colanic/teichoic acid biosynthesis glycosyltransferase
MIKRLLDIIISASLLILCLPLFFIIVILIRSTSPGQAIFTQQRVGKGKTPFRIYKFRTMRQSAPAYHLKPKDGDPDITVIGRFLRNTGLDELPQIFNVLKGEMSLVGPRPEMPFIVDRYTDQEKERLQVKPGITGLWQLSGKTNSSIQDNLEYDLVYIKNLSIYLDLKIICKTVALFLRSVNKEFRRRPV